MDRLRLVIEIYGSEGWEFESPRVRKARWAEPLVSATSRPPSLSKAKLTTSFDSNAESNAVQFGWTKTRSMASAASRSAVGITWE